MCIQHWDIYAPSNCISLWNLCYTTDIEMVFLQCARVDVPVNGPFSLVFHKSGNFLSLGLELAIDPPPPPGGILYTMIFWNYII